MLNNTPLYINSVRDAKAMDELPQWRESFKANCACCHAIEEAIRRDFDGMHLAEGCAESVIREYGFKRVEYVLANTLKEKADDGRFSAGNKEWSGRTYVPKDETHNYCFAVNSHPAVLDGFVSDFRKAYEALGLFDAQSCVVEAECQDFTGKVLVLRPKTLKENYWSPNYQLWLGRSGFGCTPGSSGRAVFATCLYDGETARWNRSDFIGPIRQDCLPDWASEQLEKLKSGQEIAPPEQEQGITL